MADKVNQAIDDWKNRLLDLGKRNRLINFREFKRSTLFIDEPNMLTLWEDLVVKKRSLNFPYFPELEETNILFDDEDIVSTLENKDRQKLIERQKTLRNLRSKAKLAMEEQGINFLYLAFGLLKWRDPGNSGDEMKSPLVLVPVSLTAASLTSPFVLKATDDEIEANPALIKKMSNDFDLELPGFSDGNDNLDEYLDSVQQLLKVNNLENKKWGIERNVVLGLFSFLKISMYSDLDKNKNLITNNPIVRAIAGDTSCLLDIPEGIADYDFDKEEKPADVFQVVDADSSQQEAILCAKSGVSFVMQGPPGTGKSQTITNIIAECLAQGKKVLFVSEKMAALDVVYKRLTSAGLEKFYLVLHSHKADKKAVLDQLRDAKDLAGKKINVASDAADKLDTLMRDREKLNKYAEQIFTKIAPLDMTIYDANGILADLNDYQDVIFRIDDIYHTSFAKFNRYKRAIEDYKKTIGK